MRATVTLVFILATSITNPTRIACARAGEDELDIGRLGLTRAMLACILILVLLTPTVDNLFGTVLALPIGITCALV